MTMEVIPVIAGFNPGSSRMPHPGGFGGKALQHRTCVF